ncbi:hypothetical protein [Streptomyces sp. NBC_01439]|uniref:hypothetical protein n=1 Tax=Streptomyces sp. NBC_01439 TaxID=2903867 RepID=UPI002E2C6939|nr:hypothetical protein [Streptomyces sp. NBC_01439]
MPVLDFEIELVSGVWIDGTASMPKPDHAYITLTDVTADEAAVFARWLRSSLAVANGEQDPWPLPAEGGEEELAAGLRRHLASVETL